MNKEQISQNLGSVLLTKWKEYCRITFVGKAYFIVDFPEKRGYAANGKLRPMPQKKVYFSTNNQVWNLEAFSLVDSHEWSLKKFQPHILVVKKENIEDNTLPTIEQSLKLTEKREPRRTKEEIERNKLMRRY